MRSEPSPLHDFIKGKEESFYLVLMVGPTAVGKTETALRLAEDLGGEIVSADSRLFYKGMDIGTAKPTLEERARIPHHLVDIAEPDETLSLSDFQHKAQTVISDIHGRGRLPILVGGTGQYIRAVVQGWTPPQVKPDLKLRAEFARLKEEKGSKWLHDRLKMLDPQAAENIDARNVRRTIRALEVILKTGKRFSELRGQRVSPYHLITVGLSRPRSELYARIDERIEAMFEQGLLEEVRGLLAKGYSPELPSMSAIGYRECIRVIEGSWGIEEAKAAMRRATRLFVRRQGSWFRESDPEIKWFPAGAEGVTGLIEEFILDELRQ